jgi:serine phosphatase RsbU (regulator of sigma subunit)/CheY-like chemotaxis protein
MTETATVLVVDDSRAKRYVITSWLRRAGHTVIEAESGGDALLRLERGGVDAVVLDVKLPDISGYEVCERIKSDLRWASLPVLQVSATATDVDDRARGLTRGADAYLAEPIEPAEFLATLQAMLRYYGARQHAERLASRLALLAQTTLAVNSAATVEELLGAAATGITAIFGGAASAAIETHDGRRMTVGVAEPGAEPQVRAWVTDVPPAPLLAAAPGTVIRLPVEPAWREAAPWFGRFDEVWGTVAQLRPNRPASYLTVAVPIGEAEDVHILSQLGQAVAQAVEAMRTLDAERNIALTLQRSLLPRAMPEVPGYDMAVRYEPASAYAEVGGDFYELAVHDGRLVVAIGDVVGHSLHAATVMAELRYALRAYVLEGHPPLEVLRRLNQLVLRLLPDEIASVCLAMLEPATGRVRLASAGHLAPLVVRDGRAEQVAVAGPMLGLPASPGSETVIELPPGATLLLYTDGLVERRGELIDAGIARLSSAAARIGPDLDACGERLMSELVSGAREDDVAVVMVRRHAAD